MPLFQFRLTVLIPPFITQHDPLPTVESQSCKTTLSKPLWTVKLSLSL